MAIARSRAIDHSRKRVRTEGPGRTAELVGMILIRVKSTGSSTLFQFTQLLEELPWEQADLIRF